MNFQKTSNFWQLYKRITSLFFVRLKFSNAHGKDKPFEQIVKIPQINKKSFLNEKAEKISVDISKEIN